jgi:hypothetical protein
MEYNELDEMMHDVEAEFIDIPKIFEKLCNESNIPLFPSCTKFMKLSGIFKLFNLKAKNYLTCKRVLLRRTAANSHLSGSRYNLSHFQISECGFCMPIC